MLRRRMSRLTRTTVKLVAVCSQIGLVVGLEVEHADRSSLPTLPVSRPPTSIGITRPPFRPMRRL